MISIFMKFFLVLLMVVVTGFSVLNLNIISVFSATLPAVGSWNNTNLQGMGFVTGIVNHPTTPNLMYARTDVGGVYKYDVGVWKPLNDFAVEVDKTTHNVESIGLS
jgi:hypothetical protein